MSRQPTNTQELADTLYKYYKGKDRLLIDELLRFLSTIVQNEQCLRPNPTVSEEESGTLSELLCTTSLAFVPHPVSKMELEKNGMLIKGKKPMAAGTFGRVYQNVMDDHHIVVKTPLLFTKEAINELFIQYVVINTILLRDRFTQHLIPSYGFFTCSSDVSNLKNKKDKNESISICKKSGGMINTVQKKINGVSFYKFMRSNPTFLAYRSMMKEIFYTLIALESCPYKIHHNDLHISNILIAENHAVLLDWGMTSFIYNEQVFQNGKEIQYHKDAPLHTGAYDAFCLFYGILEQVVHKEDEDSKKITLDILKPIDKYSSYFHEEKNGLFVPLSMHLKEYVNSFNGGIHVNNEHLFQRLEKLSFYRILKDIEKNTSSVHNKAELHAINVKQLQRLTYIELNSLFEPPLLNEDEVRAAQQSLPSELFIW